MTIGQPARHPRSRARQPRRTHLLAFGAVLGLAALWLAPWPALMTGASAASAAEVSISAQPPGTPSPEASTSAPSAPPASASATPHPSHPHSPKPTHRAKVIGTPPSAPPLGLGAQVPDAPVRAPDAGSEPQIDPASVALDEHPPEPGPPLDGWWLPGSAARPLIVSGTAALLVALVGLLVLGLRQRRL